MNINCLNILSRQAEPPQKRQRISHGRRSAGRWMRAAGAAVIVALMVASMQPALAA